jgi:putative PIN family toxin of toxin-antitoxin system
VKIVLDTNVLVSALLKPSSKPAAILRLVINGQLKLAYDSRILSEYREVLQRLRFPFTGEQITALLDFFEKDGIMAVGFPLTIHLPDPDDEPFLEVALAITADALVTGNKRHFSVSATKKVKVLSPSEFLDFFQDTEGRSQA